MMLASSGDIFVSNLRTFRTVSNTDGGAVLAAGTGTISFSNVVILSSSAAQDGGGVSARCTGLGCTTISFTNVNIREAQATREGGGIMTAGRATVILNATIYLTSSGKTGGCVASFNPLNVTDSAFTNCSSSLSGGSIMHLPLRVDPPARAVQGSFATCTLTRVNITNSQSIGSAPKGGALPSQLHLRQPSCVLNFR